MTRRCGVLVVFLLGAVFSPTTLAVAQDPVYRVGCQMGKPPFSDAEGHLATATRCVGMFADLFYAAAQRMEFAYTLEMIDAEVLEPWLELNATNQSRLDFIIGFYTITPERLNAIDFSIAMYHTKYRLGLLPSYHTSPAGLASAVLRDSVWYLLGVVAAFSLGLGVLILLIEFLTDESPLNEYPLWRRPLVALESGFDVMLSGTTTMGLSHQLSRSLRSIGALIALFVVTIFGAIITSQLTADSANQKHATLDSAKGQQVAHSLPTLDTWLREEKGLLATEVPDIETFADAFYRGERAGYDGYAAEADVAVFLHNLHGGADRGFTVSEEFTYHGTVDLKAFPLSKALNTTFHEAFDLELERMREDGELATLEKKHVAPFQFPVSKDITLDDDAVISFRVVSIVLYACYLVVAALLFAWARLKPSAVDDASAVNKHHSENGGDGPEDKPAILPTEPEDTYFTWRGEVISGVSPEVGRLLDALFAEPGEQHDAPTL